MIRLFGSACGADLASLRAQIPAQWLLSWNACHKVGKNEKAALLSLTALSLLHRAGADGTLSYDDNGRPSFLERTCDFSITHTQNHVFCALIDGEDASARIGIDAENLDRPDLSNLDEMANRWFSENEQKIFFTSPSKETFLRIWTRKEAYAKYTGEGLRTLSKVDTETLTKEGSIHFFDYRIDNILISVCASSGAEIPQDCCGF
ncbi:MAG: 4'-phosphopantetheinyl transferase superfamily protein [Ruminococcaceae bacterium]|nr:4'-phosphopantetheinyl transferase superfamily protein [Oscillospiraceae bacterium]